ncbi:MAG: homoserine dehydrogenase, partial [Actinobacteria bacterium]|nr:homoserine dehydrogenase [Actinomycetota bacterium]
TGVRLQISRVAVRNISRDREVELPEGVLTRDAHSVVNDPTVDVIVEVMGGIEPARELIAAAIAHGKPVITANKELLANVGHELWAQSDAAGVDLLFEAAVAGGIPLIRALRESLRGEPVTRVMGIVNGTTNFILTKMTDEGADYSAALSEAQRLGFAERDPTADVEGFDAGAKAAIIASIAFGARVVAGDVYHEGISGVTAADIAIARRLGYVVKLLAIAEKIEDTETIAVRVHPAMVPMNHPLASVRDSYNAVVVEGDAVGQLMFYGRGAGGFPTASAVLGDVIDAAVNLQKKTFGSIGSFKRVPVMPIDETSSQYLIGLDVEDKPGVLHAITGVFANHGVSIRAAEQEGIDDDARLVFITHRAREADVQACVSEFRKSPAVRRASGLIRVIGE